MGNCICVILGQKQRVVTNQKQESGDQKYYAKVHPVPFVSTLPSEGEKQLGEAANDLVQPLTPVVSPPKTMPMADLPKRRTVKVVVTKKQLEELLRNMKELEATGTNVHFSESFLEKERNRWHPSLATIPE